MSIISSKIRVSHIFKMHLKSLSSDQDKILLSDIFTFYIMPVIPALLLFLIGYRMDKDLTSLIINFGAIFSALLLSVLVLIYDQEKKIQGEQKEENVSDQGKPAYEIKKKIISNLYHNLCYAVLMSIFLIMFALLNQITTNIPALYCVGAFLSSITIFIILNIMFTIVMVVKRMHALLNSKSAEETEK